MILKFLLFGTGGLGVTWCQNVLPRAISEGLVEMVAAVDINPTHLQFAKKFLELSHQQCFTDLKSALAITKPQVCVVACPPEVHEAVVIMVLQSVQRILR